MMLKPTSDTAVQRLLRGVVVLVVCGLCGTFDILNNNFAWWVARTSSMSEEEEVHAKDRASQAAAAQTARRGGLRPRSAESPAGDGHRVRPLTGPTLTRTSATAQRLTGAGIFQHC
jgi:hypothetical protein